MKTLWVAAVLSFVSVGQSVPLTCDRLAKPVENAPDMSGRWQIIAISTKVCLPTVLLNSILWPSFAIDVTSKGTPNLYSGMFRIKTYGFCMNETEDFLQDNNKLFDVNRENAATGSPDILLQTSCSDCIVVKSTDVLNTLLLLSRRTTISEDELREFETQAQCVQFSKPLVLNADQDFTNCQDIENISEEQSASIMTKMYERVKSHQQNIISCLADIIYSYISGSIN
ncbi:uncharacterized protein LOC105918728 [Fundulus heteroclitus]|uniref:uncharacterized protein LOC105918728 n=1 Tax=Fundulus heteroclitus TaxID=8078 RepID=UPI00165BC1CA|nr:uncharacterized protein LOC105918728 [Fundulus heteroclitus]